MAQTDVPHDTHTRAQIYVWLFAKGMEWTVTVQYACDVNRFTVFSECMCVKPFS